MTRLTRLAYGLRRLLVALVALLVLAALLVGVPWGLVVYIGWPLPDHLPTGDEIEAALLNPLSVTLLLDILACIAWPTWAVFAVDVARCVPHALHGVRPPTIGPVHAVAGVLVVSAALGLLQTRAPAATAGPLPSVNPASAVMTTNVEVPRAVTYSVPQADDTAGTRPEHGVVVQPPRAGIHDSLWRIAQRELGDGHRWIELYQLNQGRPQADGHVLSDPHLIRPGWILQLPDDAAASPAPPAPKPPPAPVPPQQPPPQPPAAQPAPDAAPDRHHAPVPDAVSRTSGTAITLWSGGLVAAALAGSVALAMVIRRRKRRRVYKPGSGDRTPPPTPAPAVHALRLAYDEVQLDEGHEDDAESIGLDDEQPSHESTAIAAGHGDIDSASIEIGVRDERARALDLAAVHGLGLTGAGAEATARSLLVHLLGTTHATVVIPADDARALLGAELSASARLHVTDDLSGAVAALEERCSPDSSGDEASPLHTVVVAEIDRPHARLQSLLDVGSDRGVAGILLGHWPAGATVRVRADGVVAAASPFVDELRGSCLFHLDATDTRDLLALLAEAPSSSAPQPADSTPEPALDDHARITDEREETDDGSLDDERMAASVPEPEVNAEPNEDDEHSCGDEPRHPETDSNGIEDADIENTSVLRTDVEQTPVGTATADADVPTLVGAAERTRQHPERPWELSVFGPVTLTWHSLDGHAHDITSVLAPKHKALLVFLALHPSGTTREAVREALWPDARGRRPLNAFYASLSQLRKAFSRATDDRAVDFVSQHDEQVALDSSLVEVDYWHLYEAEHERHTAATDEDRMAAWSRMAAVYQGEIADGMSALWLEGPREAAHRTVVDALAGMAAHYRGHDPHRQLQLLEHARLLNPENEDIYRDIMRVQAQLGFTDAISRTVQLLTTTLAEIGERPDPNTLTLARALQARQHRVAS